MGEKEECHSGDKGLCPVSVNAGLFLDLVDLVSVFF